MQAFDSVEAYLDTLETPDRTQLERVRKIILNTVPDAVESISYGMPAYKYKGKPLMYYASFKNHYSIFPTAGPPEFIADKLADYKTGKGTVQFTADKPLPDSTIVELLHLRMAQIDE